jgi:hypothetical protein
MNVLANPRFRDLVSFYSPLLNFDLSPMFIKRST